MADLDIANPIGITDKRQGRGSTAGNSMAEFANTGSVSLLKTRLTALDAGYFTAARLHTMLENDMLYALRVRSADSAGI